MRLLSAAHGMFFFVLAAALFTAEAQSRRRITVRTYRTNYRIDTWDDGRDELYRVTYWKFGLQSVFTFDAGGHVRTLTSRDTLYTIGPAGPSRMLMDSDDDALEDVETDLTPAIDCTTCYNTWETLCDAGLTDVCLLDANNPANFDNDADDSVRRFCGAVGAACERTATDVCGNQCDPGPDPEPTAAPTEAPTPEPTPATPESTPAPTPEPTQSTPEPTPASTPELTPAPTPEPTPATPEPTPSTSEPTPTPISEPTPATPEPTPAPTAEPTQAAPEPTPAPTSEPTPATPEPTPVPTVEPTPATPEPTLAPTPEPTPVPTSEQMDACNPNPCGNGGSCSIDPAGGHTCSCSDGFGGMSCQIDTSALASFFIQVDFIGVWTDSRRAVFQSAADRWSEVVTHVPCGGSEDSPAGRLLITATLEEIDGAGGTLGFASPTMNWIACPTIILEGEMTFDIDDIISLEAIGTFEGVILHEMGHVIGVGTVWGADLGECSTCFTDGSPAWTCPAALETYADIGGSGANIVETDFGDGSRCGHLDEVIFDQELMTPIVDNPMFLSKMTAATLEDINYIVDTSMVDPYVLPSAGGGSIEEEREPSIVIRDTAVETVIISMDSDGNIVDEMIGLAMVF